MVKMWQKKPFFCDSSLPSLADKYTIDDVQAAVDADFVEVRRRANRDAFFPSHPV